MPITVVNPHTRDMVDVVDIEGRPQPTINARNPDFQPTTTNVPCLILVDTEANEKPGQATEQGLLSWFVLFDRYRPIGGEARIRLRDPVQGDRILNVVGPIQRVDPWDDWLWQVRCEERPAG